MKRFCLIAAVISLTIFGAHRSALARGGHRHHGGHHFGHHGGHHFGHHGGHHFGHHGYHYGHHGLHFSLGHLSYGYRRHHYGYYNYPRYYSSYRNPSCYSPTVIYSQPTPRVVVPPQQPAAQIENPKVDPPPQLIPGPSDPLSNPGSTRPSRTGVQFTSIPNAPRINTIQGVNSSRPSTLDLGLSTLLTITNRPIMSDEATPWIVGETSLPESAVRLVDDHQSRAPTKASQREAQAKPPQQIPATMKGIARLSSEDQQAALAQRICPVTGDLLGSQGKPLRVQIGDRTVFVCCDDCVKDLRTAAAAKYLASDR